MSESNAQVHALIGAYVVDALDADERAEFEAHLAECGACREEVASLLGVGETLASAEAVPPPAGLRADVLAQIGQTPQAVPAPASGIAQPEPRKRWAPRLVLAAASALLLVAVGVVGVNAYQTHRETVAMEHDVMMVTTAPDAHSMDLALGTSHVVMSESMSAVVVMGDEAPMPADGMEYQVFLMMEDGSSMPGPAFTPGADGDFMTVMSAPMDGVVGVAVTEEPMGGSPSMTGEMVALVHL